MSTAELENTGTSDAMLFGRILENSRGEMAVALARYVLTLGFSESDQTRMTDLAERNQAGALSAEEHEELTSYVRTGHLLALLHAKARMSLSNKRKA